MKSKFLHICVIALAGHTFVSASDAAKIQALTSQVDSLQLAATELVDANLNSQIATLKGNQEEIQGMKMDALADAGDAVAENAQIIHETKKETQILLIKLQAGEKAAQDAISAQIAALKTAQEAAAAEAEALKINYEAANAKLTAMQDEGGAVGKLKKAADTATEALKEMQKKLVDGTPEIAVGEEGNEDGTDPIPAVPSLLDTISDLDSSAATSSALADIQGKVRNITGSVIELQRQVVRKAEKTVTGALASQIESRADTSKLKELSGKVENGLSNKADKTALNSLESRLGTQIDRIENRISTNSTSSTSSSSNSTAIDNLQQELSKVKVQVATQRSSINGLQKNVASLEGGKSTASDLNAASKKISEDLEGKADKSEYTTLKSDTMLLKNESEYLKSNISDLSNRLSTFNVRMQTFDKSTISADALSTLRSEFETTKDTITGLEKQADNNENAIAAANSIYEALNTSLADALMKLTALKNAIEPHVTGEAEALARANTNIASLKAQIEALGEAPNVKYGEAASSDEPDPTPTRTPDEVRAAEIEGMGTLTGLFYGKDAGDVYDALYQSVADVSDFVGYANALNDVNLSSDAETNAATYLNTVFTSGNIANLRRALAGVEATDPAPALAEAASAEYSSVADALAALKAIVAGIAYDSGYKYGENNATAANIVAAMKPCVSEIAAKIDAAQQP